MRNLVASLALAAVAACGGSNAQTSATPAAPAAPKTVFADAPPYTSGLPAVTAAAAHAAKKVAAPSIQAPCLTCHKEGGGAPSFAFAGTIYTDEAMSKGSADVEIRIADANGKSASAHSDADGNFWSPGAPIALPAHAGARSGAKTLAMGSIVDKADCNGCHDAKFPMLLTPPK
jgi:hypothetical protein